MIILHVGLAAGYGETESKGPPPLRCRHAVRWLRHVASCAVGLAVAQDGSISSTAVRSQEMVFWASKQTGERDEDLS